MEHNILTPVYYIFVKALEHVREKFFTINCGLGSSEEEKFLELNKKLESLNLSLNIDYKMEESLLCKEDLEIPMPCKRKKPLKRAYINGNIQEQCFEFIKSNEFDTMELDCNSMSNNIYIQKNYMDID